MEAQRSQVAVSRQGTLVSLDGTQSDFSALSRMVEWFLHYGTSPALLGNGVNSTADAGDLAGVQLHIGGIRRWSFFET